MMEIMLVEPMLMYEFVHPPRGTVNAVMLDSILWGGYLGDMNRKQNVVLLSILLTHLGGGSASV